MKDRILNLVTGLSLAVAKELASRDNGIGRQVDSKEGFESLFKIRKTIIQENVHLILKDKEIGFKDRSFLNGITDQDMTQSEYGDISPRLADIIQNELLRVRDEFIPTVNSISKEIENKIAELGNINIQNKYDVRYVGKSNILTLLLESELQGLESAATVDISGVNFMFDRLEDFTLLRGYMLTGNPISDSAINAFLDTRSDSYWLDLYNSVFTYIKPNNALLLNLLVNRIGNLDNSIFLYLVSRNYSNKVPFVVTGQASEVKYSVRVLNSFLAQVVAMNASILNNYTNNKLLVMSVENDVITINKELLGDLDVDTVIGAVIDGDYTLNTILENKDKLKQLFIETNELYTIAEMKRLVDKYRVIYMEILDLELPKTSEDYDRLAVADFIYSKTVEELAKVNKVIALVLSKTIYQDTNTEFIFNSMVRYMKMFDKDSTDFSAVAEYVALELVTKYIVNVHIEILN